MESFHISEIYITAFYYNNAATILITVVLAVLLLVTHCHMEGV